MKMLIIFILMLSSLQAKGTLENFVKAYKDRDMSLACTLGRKLYRSNMRDEKILIATGHACAEDDFIDFIGVLQQRLGETASSRKATVYFSTLLLKKRLISEFMHEGSDLSGYTLPQTDHILSQVFEGIKNDAYTTLSASPRRIRIGNEQDYIDVSVKKKIYIKVYKGGKLVKEHRYR